MRSKFLFITLFLVIASTHAFGQHGGKAEPNRIQFATGTTSKTLTGTLRTGQEMEYVFGATKGQIVTIKNTGWRIFDFRVFSEENFPDGDFDSSPTYSFEIPETGDYVFSVRKKVAGPRSARFSITLSIK